MKKHRNRLFRSVQRTILYLALMMTVLACALFYVVSRQVLLNVPARPTSKAFDRSIVRQTA